MVRTVRTPVTILPCIPGPTTGIRQSVDGTIHVSFAGGDYDVRWDSLRHAHWFAPALKGNRGSIGLNFGNLILGLLPSPATPAVADIPPSKQRISPDPARAKQLAEMRTSGTISAISAALSLDRFAKGRWSAVPDMA